ncbi:MAG: response regulator [Deltaproteobacteria bacterium]|nr:response regulator [Deltaproteobacteria bacterium]
MRKGYNILIADRNPHVRELLRREMTLEGYQVQLAKTGREVINCVYNQDPLDLLILDPDLPDTDESFLLKKLGERIPPLPVVVHSFLSENSEQQDVLTTVTFVEKRGSSIDHLKKIVSEILEKV